MWGKGQPSIIKGYAFQWLNLVHTWFTSACWPSVHGAVRISKTGRQMYMFINFHTKNKNIGTYSTVVMSLC